MLPSPSIGRMTAGQPGGRGWTTTGRPGAKRNRSSKYKKGSPLSRDCLFQFRSKLLARFLLHLKRLGVNRCERAAGGQHAERLQLAGGVTVTVAGAFVE